MAQYAYDSEFPSLDLDRPEEGILRLTLRAPGRLNAVSEAQHGELRVVGVRADFLAMMGEGVELRQARDMGAILVVTVCAGVAETVGILMPVRLPAN